MFPQTAVLQVNAGIAFSQGLKAQEFAAWSSQTVGASSLVLTPKKLHETLIQRPGDQPLIARGWVGFEGNLEFGPYRDFDRLGVRRKETLGKDKQGGKNNSLFHKTSFCGGKVCGNHQC